MKAMLYALLADAVMLVHGAFVLFVSLGALLLLWRRWFAWLHLPCVLYGVAIELFGWVCPLTPLENRFRHLAGGAGYEGGFIDHYLEGLLYPPNWARIHLILAAGLVLLNVVLYTWILTRARGAEDDADPPGS